MCPTEPQEKCRFANVTVVLENNMLETQQWLWMQGEESIPAFSGIRSHPHPAPRPLPEAADGSFPSGEGKDWEAPVHPF